MKISELAIDRSTTILVLLAIILVSGTYSYLTLPRESEPEVVIPYVNVSTQYEGVSAEDMETLVTIPIERKLSGLKGMEEITSTSVEGVSSIVIEFEADFDVDDSLQKVRDKVNEAKPDLPEEAEEPVITEINAAEMPIIYLALDGQLGLAAMTEIAEDVEDDLESIAGVLDVEVIGGVEREIQIIVDPERLTQYGVSLVELARITDLENVNTPSGAMNLGTAKYLMRVPGEFRTPDELTGLVVKRGESGVVYLRDIAKVVDGFKEMNSRSRVNGDPSITLTLSKRAGENVIAISEAVEEAVARWQKRLPDGVNLGITFDESEFVRSMVNELESGILSGLILVLIVILIFLGFANAVFVALAIPVSMLITFIVLDITDVTLNMVVLFSLILALGMLVDNGIVVVENIYRHMQTGKDRVRAAKDGAAEVAWPISAATLTTVAAFAPMLFWPGMMGKFMGFLPRTVIIALLASLFVGLVVNPALASRFMTVRKRLDEEDGVPRNVFMRRYEGLLNGVLRWRALVLACAAMGMVVVMSAYMASARVEFTPTVEPFRAFINIELPQGTNLDTSDFYVKQVEGIVQPWSEDVDYIIATAGAQSGSEANFESAFAANETHKSQVTLDFPELEDSEVLPSVIVQSLRGEFGHIAGAEIRIEKEMMGPPTGPPINVEISGDDYGVLKRLAEEIKAKVVEVSGAVDVRDDYEAGKPEVRVNVDRQQAWLTDLNTEFVGQTVKAAIQGIVASTYREGDEEYDVVVRFPEWFKEDLTNIENMTFVNQDGYAIPFGSLASIDQGTGLGSIVRQDRKRTITVSADVEGRTGPEALADVQTRLSDYPLPGGYTIEFTGENEDTEETTAFLSRAFFVALLLIFLVMVTQFNNLLQPLIIMTSVVLSLAGVFLGLLIFDMPFGVLMTGIGSISLAGVVVNNGIVMVDFINQLRARGLPVNQAIVRGSITRFRPVMLTAVTTILGLTPMACGVSFDFRELRWIVGGTTSQFWSPMAISVIFGLAFATVLTLVVVPVLYSVFYSLEKVLRDTMAGDVDRAPSSA